MSYKFVSALFIMALMVVCVPVWAQEDEPDPTFELLRDSASAASELELELEEQAKWVPALRSGSVEVSFFLGFLGLKTTLLSHEQIIYKYTNEATYWGDVTFQGQSAFNPGLRLGYNLKQWLCLEAISTVSFSEYTTSAVNRSRRPNEPGAPVDFDEPPLGEFDLETRSMITGSIGLNAVVYPFDIKGEATGMFHPYATGGISAMWYDMNSNYTAGAAGTTDVNIGIGLRLLADRNISVRLEVLYHNNNLEFAPSQYFTELNEGTTKVPLNEYPIDGDRYTEQRVTSYESNNISSIGFSLGVQGTF